MSDWRDIESAPRDGTRILVCDAGDDPDSYITAWSDDVYTFQGGKGGPRGWFSGSYADHWGDRPTLDNPKFWQPLPAPPESAA